MDIEDIKSQFEIVDLKIKQKQFKKNQLIELLESETDKQKELVEKRSIANRSSLFLKSRAYNVRKNSIDVVNQIVTDALKPIYGDDYEFVLAINEEKLAKGESSGFNIKPLIISDIDGKRIATSVQSARGGGVTEIVSVILRFAFLKLVNYNGLIVLDETWASVSADEKMLNLIDFLNYYVKEADVQVLFITHRAEMFGKNADNIIHVNKSNGVADIKKISYNDIINSTSNL